jgi:hypothetical protein
MVTWLRVCCCSGCGCGCGGALLVIGPTTKQIMMNLTDQVLGILFIA